MQQNGLACASASSQRIQQKGRLANARGTIDNLSMSSIFVSHNVVVELDVGRANEPLPVVAKKGLCRCEAFLGNAQCSPHILEVGYAWCIKIRGRFHLFFWWLYACSSPGAHLSWCWFCFVFSGIIEYPNKIQR